MEEFAEIDPSLRPILAIVGPTASGKTKLALSLAQRVPIEIISMDSVMIYRGMDIGSAKPDQSTLRRFPHGLVDIIDPTEIYSVADFLTDADDLVKKAWRLGRLPVLVGGTMLYMKAFREGLAPVPPADLDLRFQLEREAEILGHDALYRELEKVDPEAASNIHPNNHQRLKRAIEVYRLTGKPISSFWNDQESPGAASRLRAKMHVIALIPEDRAVWRQKINSRFAEMLAVGLVEEVQSLRSLEGLHGDLPSMKAVGYRQAWEYLNGSYTYEEFQERAIVATRQLAKRQLTWLRSWDWANVVSSLNDNEMHKIVDELMTGL